MGMKLNEIYHGMELPGKFKMAVSGCNPNCAKLWVTSRPLRPEKSWWVFAERTPSRANAFIVYPLLCH